MLALQTGFCGTVLGEAAHSLPRSLERCGLVKQGGPLREDSSARALICMLAAKTPSRTCVVQVEGGAHLSDSVSIALASVIVAPSFVRGSLWEAALSSPHLSREERG